MYTTSTNNILFKSITEAGRHFNIKHAKLGYMMKKNGFVKVPGGILKRHELLLYLHIIMAREFSEK